MKYKCAKCGKNWGGKIERQLKICTNDYFYIRNMQDNSKWAEFGALRDCPVCREKLACEIAFVDVICLHRPTSHKPGCYRWDTCPCGGKSPLIKLRANDGTN